MVLDLCIFLSRYRKENFSLEESNIMDRGTLFEVKNILMLRKTFNWWNGVVWISCGLLWCFYQLFWLSIWWHPFTAENPRLSKWCNAKLVRIISKDGFSLMVWERVNVRHIFILRWTIPLRLIEAELMGSILWVSPVHFKDEATMWLSWFHASWCL